MKNLKNIFANKSMAYVMAGTLALGLVSCKDDDKEDGPQSQSMALVSTNTGMAIRVLNTLNASTITGKTINVSYADADGIHYDNGNDRIIQFDRSGDRLVAYNQVSTLDDGANITPAFSLSTAVDNGREITVNGATIVVADDQDTGINKLHVFTVGDENFTADKVYETEFNLWGIQLVGSTLYAVVDNSSKLAIFYNFGSKDAGTLTADKTIDIEGIVRTHGLHYVESKDMMLLTDVGIGTIDNDGAIRIISSFSTKLSGVADGGTLAAADQVDISGLLTGLGNPVDIAYDLNTDRIYVAERANLGGRILGFDTPATNSTDAPDFNEIFIGASAIYLQN